MKKFEKPIVTVLLLEDVDVLTTSGGDEEEPDKNYRQSGSRGPWGENPWDE